MGMKEWIYKEEPLIRSDGASVDIEFRQMQELVRCKDCINYGNIGCRLKRMAYQTAPDWYCADGERKEDGERDEID